MSYLSDHNESIMGSYPGDPPDDEGGFTEHPTNTHPVLGICKTCKKVHELIDLVVCIECGNYLCKECKGYYCACDLPF